MSTFTKIFLLAALLFLFIVLLHRASVWILRYKEREWAFRLKAENNKSLAPLRLTAYERIIVMLERITPTPLVMRLRLSAHTSGMLQLELIKAIREEFEHNVSLQMYVSQECWEKVRKAKEETTELVKVAFTRVRPESGGLDLCNEIFRLEAATGNAAIREAIMSVRAEMARYY